MNVRPVSDLLNHYGDFEKTVMEEGPVLLTKDGYDSLVVMSIEQFERINGTVESALDAADRQADTTAMRYSHNDVFGSIRRDM